jgi:hypothetical protein
MLVGPEDTNAWPRRAFLAVPFSGLHRTDDRTSWRRRLILWHLVESPTSSVAAATEVTLFVGSRHGGIRRLASTEGRPANGPKRLDARTPFVERSASASAIRADQRASVQAATP